MGVSTGLCAVCPRGNRASRSPAARRPVHAHSGDPRVPPPPRRGFVGLYSWICSFTMESRLFPTFCFCKAVYTLQRSVRFPVLLFSFLFSFKSSTFLTAPKLSDLMIFIWVGWKWCPVVVLLLLYFLHYKRGWAYFRLFRGHLFSVSLKFMGAFCCCCFGFGCSSFHWFVRFLIDF